MGAIGFGRTSAIKPSKDPDKCVLRFDSGNGITFEDARHHMLAMGTTGSGKTANVVLPAFSSLIGAGHGGIVLDIKGNLREQAYILAQQHGRCEDLVEFGSAATATPLNLLQLQGKLEIGHGIFYQPRGSILTLPDGRTVLFAGGAASIDRGWLTAGVDWFPGEILTSHEFRTQFPAVDTVDIVIAHTAPASVTLPSSLDHEFYDPSRAVLEAILHRYRPSLWFCGHFHIPYKQTILNGACAFVALACVAEWGGVVMLEEFDGETA